MKKLPIGVQSFDKIRADSDYYYVDKTPMVAGLCQRGGGYFFLSRPRRFGKSLFLSTLKHAFLGNREYFQGLYLESHWDWGVRYPVIHISFGSGVIQDRADLGDRFRYILKENARNSGVALTETNLRERFLELIDTLYRKHKTKLVILVDEYDKPILDNIDRPEIATAIRDELKNFYSVIKDADASLKFVFITGVSKFSKVSLFSGLNNLQDITLHEQYATICGYTHEEMLSTFAERLDGVDVAEVRRWYNGYNFLGEPVYNPFDVLLFLDTKDFRNYWFETGSPSFLIKLIQQKRYPVPNLEQVRSTDELLSSFDVNRIELVPLLWQTGYLTIRKTRRMAASIGYTLDYPNLEVKYSLTNAILNELSQESAAKTENMERLYDCLSDQEDLSCLRDIFYAFFASIPNEWYSSSQVASYEAFYASVFYCYFTALGLDVRVEDSTNHGRIDMTVLHEGRVFIMEFKVVELDRTSGAAIEQIRRKRYWEKYQTAGAAEIILIGVEFSKAERNITAYEWERVKA
jgi:hypothetical protein